MKIGVIYAIINNINGRLYVGKSVNFADRIQRHKTSKQEDPLHRSIRKNGWKNFSVEILENNICEADLNHKEKFWIKHLYSVEFGYNLTYGGDGAASGHLHPHKSKEARARLSKIHNNPIVKRRNTQAKIHKMIAIRCLETNQIFQSINDAARCLSIQAGHISENIRNLRTKVKGYSFMRIK